MNIPENLLYKLQSIQDFSQNEFFAAHDIVAPVSIRINPKKYINFNQNLEPIPWCSYGYYLKERPSFTLDPLFHAGAYYVQEASSMFLAQVFQQYIPKKPLKILDLCAAPGGKSTLAASYMPEGSLLVSNEVIKTRVKILEENIIKFGDERVVITNNDPLQFENLPHYFDIIIVDAPCSGSGLFRKEPEAINEWSEAHVDLCSGRQKRILKSAVKALKPGGILIYSTCSFSPEENESIVDEISETYTLSPLSMQTESHWQITESLTDKGHPTYRFWPHRVKGEGFFMAVFRKEATENGKTNHKEIIKWKEVPRKNLEIFSPWVDESAEKNYIQINENYYMLPETIIQPLKQLAQALYIKKAGINIGRLAGKEIIPDHELAMSNIYHPNIRKTEVDTETALEYLRKNPILTPEAQKGWNLITHQQLPLGWLKVLDGRSNNYYPKDWRILKR